MMSTSRSSATAAAPTQSPSLQVASNSIDPKGTPDNPITFVDSSDDDIGSATMPKVINNEILSISYCYLDGCMMMFILLDLHTSSQRLE